MSFLKCSPRTGLDEDWARFQTLNLTLCPGTHIVGSWVIDRKSLYRDPRTGTQYIGNWASRVRV